MDLKQLGCNWYVGYIGSHFCFFLALMDHKICIKQTPTVVSKPSQKFKKNSEVGNSSLALLIL